MVSTPRISNINPSSAKRKTLWRPKSIDNLSVFDYTIREEMNDETITAPFKHIFLDSYAHIFTALSVP